MTKRNVMIDILTARIETSPSLFGKETEKEKEGSLTFAEFANDFEVAMPEPVQMLMEGKLLTDERRVELVYAESELTGMQGSMTAIGFDRDNPNLVSMIRTGPVRTAMTFEEGKRHICLYNTPFCEFEICVRTIKVENRLLEENQLELYYIIEVHGAQAERCKMTITVRPGAQI